MSVAAYYLTLLGGMAALALTAYGISNDIRNKAYPRSLDEWALTLGIAIAGIAMVITAMKAITS